MTMKLMMAATGLMMAGELLAGATGKPPSGWGNKMNWQAWATTTTLPSMCDAVALTDGDTDSSVSFLLGGEAGAELKIAFPKPADVKGLRFCQKRFAANHFQVYADLEGKGNYSQLVKDQTDSKPIVDQWIEIPVGKTVTGLRLVFLAGEVGYRAVFPRLAELEIYGNGGGGGVGGTGGTPVATAESIEIPHFKGKGVEFRVCTDWWNWSIGSWDKQGRKVPLREWPAYRDRLSEFKELGVTSVRLFAESESCEKNGGFSSFPLAGLPAEQQHDYMKPLAEALHQDGFKIYYFSHAWRAPIQKIGKQPEMPWLRWDYPYMASDALVGVNEHYTEWYPCVLSDDDFRVKWTDLLRGALKAGADGVYLCPDEYFYKGHNLSRCTCKSCQRAFKKMFGFEALPKLTPPKVAQNKDGQVSAPIPVDTEQYRKYKFFEYRKLADLFDRVGQDLRREFPKATLVMNENQGAVLSANGRLEHTVCNDMFGASAVYDEKQVYGGFLDIDSTLLKIAFVKHFEAACGLDRLLSSAGWGPGNLAEPTEQINGVVPEVFLGCPKFEVYRLNYMYEFSGLSTWKKTLRMINLMQAWGLKDSVVPADVGFVYSRASEDWWRVKLDAQMDSNARSKATDFNLNLADESINKVVAGSDSPDRQRVIAQERMRGWGAQRVIESLLGSNGFDYQVVYAERPDNMKNLKRFPVLVIPFAYSLSDSAAAEIKAALAAGTKIVLFDQLGATDEYGTIRKTPVLKGLVGQKGVTYIAESPFDTSADLKKLRGYREEILKARGAGAGYFYDPNGSRTVRLVREMKDGKGWLVYLCSIAHPTAMWSPTRTARVTIGLPAAEGTSWKMETYSSDSGELSRNTVSRSYDIPAKTLNRFSVSVEPQEAKLIRIYR